MTASPLVLVPGARRRPSPTEGVGKWLASLAPMPNVREVVRSS